MLDMEFKHLDIISDRKAIRSSTKDSESVSSTTGGTKVNFEDSCGAMAKINAECDDDVFYACDLYCFRSKLAYEELRKHVYQSIVADMRDDNKKDIYKAVDMSDIAISKVFSNGFSSDGLCGLKMGMSKQGYAKTWAKYVNKAVDGLVGALSNGDMIAGEYHKDEKRVA